VGIDGKVVTGLANVEKMVELTSGCICCSIDDYRFDLAIQEIIDTAKPHLIIIESTGLADPEPLAYRVKNAGLGLDAVITLVDAANVERQLEETEVARAQIEAADFLVVNKLDLVGEGAVARLERRLAKLNPRAERMKTVRGALDSDVLFATGVAAFRERARAGSNHLHADGIGTFLYRTRLPLRQETFERLLRRLPADVLRAKGIVRFTGRDWHCLFNFTCGRHELTWVKLDDAGMEELGDFRRLASTNPPQSPVAWTTFATGTGPGRHGIFDFIERDPATYLPDVGTGGVRPPRYWHGVVQSAPAEGWTRRRGVPFWQVAAEHGVHAVVLRVPYAFPPDPVPGGRMLSGLGVPDLLGTNS